MTDKPLPKHPRKYESYWEEGMESTDCWVICPNCEYYNPASWDQLESGTNWQCGKCKYRWVLENEF